MSDNPDFPPIVYKYRNWTDINHQNMLRNNELYLSSPADFNDPFDCRIPENFYLLDTPAKIDEYIGKVIDRQYDTLLKDRIDLKLFSERMKLRLTNRLDQVQGEHEQITFEALDRNYGVLSLSARWDSILMWSHYAQNHKGYCIGFHEEELCKAKLFGRGGMVITPDDNNYPAIDPNDDDIMKKVILQTQYKSNEWAYENEYRLTSLLPGLPTVNDRKRFVTNACVAELTLGLQTPEDHKQEMIEIALTKGIKVFQTVKVPFKFLIDRIQIA
ncbi:DUF2971 domain-containing protein [Mucilaginibacter sp. R-33]|uniref:DUF2971 domain-containing protein n=1 Tax=Mucilaginibacter sp. R-33 TaxID=3416711 RepID=UPI003CE70212